MRKFHDSICIRIEVSKKGVKMMINIRRSRHE
ncbi:GNAT family N-acetyltransferase, partial [Salmonella enterica subsp. enterica serovar Heidelberg]|nr:GNAT family N-acetyltransferase [Salmonella enterica subsp. enterica serovar Heidelberg]